MKNLLLVSIVVAVTQNVMANEGPCGGYADIYGKPVAACNVVLQGDYSGEATYKAIQASVCLLREASGTLTTYGTWTTADGLQGNAMIPTYQTTANPVVKETDEVFAERIERDEKDCSGGLSCLFASTEHARYMLGYNKVTHVLDLKRQVVSGFLHMNKKIQYAIELQCEAVQ